MTSMVGVQTAERSPARAAGTARHATPPRRFTPRRWDWLAMVALVAITVFGAVLRCARVQRARALPRRRLGRALLAGRDRDRLAHVGHGPGDLLRAADLHRRDPGDDDLAAGARLRGRRCLHPRDVHAGPLLQAGPSRRPGRRVRGEPEPDLRDVLDPGQGVSGRLPVGLSRARRGRSRPSPPAAVDGHGAGCRVGGDVPLLGLADAGDRGVLGRRARRRPPGPAPPLAPTPPAARRRGRDRGGRRPGGARLLPPPLPGGKGVLGRQLHPARIAAHVRRHVGDDHLAARGANGRGPAERSGPGRDRGRVARVVRHRSLPQRLYGRPRARRARRLRRRRGAPVAPRNRADGRVPLSRAAPVGRVRRREDRGGGGRRHRTTVALARARRRGLRRRGGGRAGRGLRRPRLHHAPGLPGRGGADAGRRDPAERAARGPHLRERADALPVGPLRGAPAGHPVRVRLVDQVHRRQHEPVGLHRSLGVL